MATMTLKEIAELVAGRVVNLERDGHLPVHGVSAIHEGQPATLTFCAHDKYREWIERTRASAVLLNEEFATPAPTKPAIVCTTPDYGFALVAEKLLADYPPRPAGIHPNAVVAKTAIIGEGACIQPFAVVDEYAVIGPKSILESFSYIGYKSRVGARCHIYQQAVVREHCILGDDVILQPGSIIGGDGFGYAQFQGGIKKIPQLGNVILEDDVEIGANATIDRARFKHTLIGRSAKLDNLVMIAHNCEVGAGTMMAAQSGMAGSAKIGKGCSVAGQVGFAGHITVGDNATLGARTAVSKDLPGHHAYLGEPAMPAAEFKRILAANRRLPDLLRRIREMEQQLADLSAKLGGTGAGGSGGERPKS